MVRPRLLAEVCRSGRGWPPGVDHVADPAADPAADLLSSRCSCSIRQLLAEEAGGLEHQDRDQDPEDEGVRPVRREEAVTERIDEAEDERAEHGALQVADPAEDGRRERVEAEPEAEVPDRRVVVEDLDDAGRTRQRTGDQEGDARSSG